MECHQMDCIDQAKYRYTWPGRDQEHICESHGQYLLKVADAIGMHLQLILLEPEQRETEEKPEEER